jgi:hypothetical protein
MRNSTPRLLGIALLAGLAWTGAALAQSAPPPAQSTPPTQSTTQQQPADTPADAAARSKDATADAPPKKVYTNDDLHSMHRADVSVVGPGKAQKPAKDSSTEPKNEPYWHNRAQKLRDQIAEVDRQIADFTRQEQTAAGTSGSSAPATPPPPGAYTVGARSRSSAQLERLQNRKAALETQMDQLQDEARRANVPPGWLR